jgi:hypothetical protein
MTDYSFPKTMKKLRACTRCHLVKTEEQVTIINIVFIPKL